MITVRVSRMGWVARKGVWESGWDAMGGCFLWYAEKSITSHVSRQLLKMCVML